MNKEIVKLKKKILQLCAMVEENVRKAVDSVVNRDIDEAKLVNEQDIAVDQMEIEIEEECLKILALHQPVANDLRYVIACLKMNNDLERIADLSANIARRTISVAEYPNEDIPLDFYPMMDKTQAMLKKTLDAMIDMDPELAHEVMVQDDEIDEFNRQMHLEVHRLIKDNPEKAEFFIHLLSVSKQLERIGDYATNIAEDVIYMVRGEIVRHQGKPEK